MGIGFFSSWPGLLVPYRNLAYGKVIFYHNLRWLLNNILLVNVSASWPPFLSHLMLLPSSLHVVLSGRNPRLRLLGEAVPCSSDVRFIYIRV